nr:hypothetical protein B0A51_10153 [Rachicladosporium sp. CCFEE 5018]
MSRAQPPEDMPDYRNIKVRFGTHSIPNYGALIWDSLQDITLKDEKSWNAFDALKQRFYKVENTIDRSHRKGVVGGGEGTLGPWTAEELETDQKYLEAKRAYVKGLVSGLQRHDDPSGVLGGVLIESGVFDEVLAVHSEDLGVAREVQELHLSDAGWVAVTRIVRGGKATLLVCDGRECKICAHAEEPEPVKGALATAAQDQIPQLDTNIEVVDQQQPADRIDSAVPSEIDYGHTGIPLVPSGPRQSFNPIKPRFKRAGRGKRFALNERFPNGQMRPVSTSLADLLGAALPPTDSVVDGGAAQEDGASKPMERNAQDLVRLDTAMAPPPPSALQRRPQTTMPSPGSGIRLRPQPNGLAAAMPYHTHLARIMQPPYRPTGMTPNMHAQRPGALKIAQTTYIPPATNSAPTLSRPSSAIAILPHSTKTIDASAFRLTARKAALSATAMPFQTTSPVKIGGVASSAGVAAAKKAVRSDEEALKLFISRKEAWERSLGSAAKGGAAFQDGRVEARSGGVEKSGACAEVMARADEHAHAQNAGAAEENVSDGCAVATLKVTPSPTCASSTATPKPAARVALPLPILRITNPDAPAKVVAEAITASGEFQDVRNRKAGTGGASAESVATSSNTSLPYSAPSSPQSPPPVPQRARKKKPQGSSGEGRVVKKATRATAIATSGSRGVEDEEEHRVIDGHGGSFDKTTLDTTQDPTMAAQHVLDQAAILRQRLSDCAWLPDAERAVVMKKLDAELEDLERYAPSVLERLEESSQSQLPEGSDEVEEPVLAAEDDRHSQGTESGHGDEERNVELRVLNDRHGVSGSGSLTIRPYMGVTRIPRSVKQTATMTIATASEKSSSREGTPIDDSAGLCTPTTTEPRAPPAVTYVAPSASGTSIAISSKPQATPKSYLETLPVNGSEFVEAKAFWDSKRPSITFDGPPSSSSAAVVESLPTRLTSRAQGHEIALAKQKKELTPPPPTLPLKQRPTGHSFWDSLPSAEVFEEGQKGLTWQAQAALKAGLRIRVLKLDSADDAARPEDCSKAPDLSHNLESASIRKDKEKKVHALNAEARIVRALKRAELTAEDGEAIRRSIDSITAPVKDVDPILASPLAQRTKPTSWSSDPSTALNDSSALRSPVVMRPEVPLEEPIRDSTAQRFAPPTPNEYIAGQRRETKSARSRQLSVLHGAAITATATNAPLVICGPFSFLRELTCDAASVLEPSSKDIAKIMAKWQHGAEESSTAMREDGPEKEHDGLCEAVSELSTTTGPSRPVADATSPRPPNAELVTQRSSHRLRAMRERREVQTTGEAEAHSSPTASSKVQTQRKIRQRRDSLAVARERPAPLHRPVLGSEQSDDDTSARCAHTAAPTIVDEAIETGSRTRNAHDLMSLQGGPPSAAMMAPVSRDLATTPDDSSASGAPSTRDTPRSATAQTSSPRQSCSAATGPPTSRTHSFWHAVLSASSALTSDFWGTNFVGDFEDGTTVAPPGEHTLPEHASVIVLRRLRAIVMMIVLVVITVMAKIALLQEPDPNGGLGPSWPLPGDSRRGR